MAEQRVKNLEREYSKVCSNVPSTTSAECDLCGRVLDKPQLDHDHQTGLFRGWLCRRCNTGLGFLGDTIASLERAVAYLRRSTSITELHTDQEIA